MRHRVHDVAPLLPPWTRRPRRVVKKPNHLCKVSETETENLDLPVRVDIAG